MNYRLKEDRSNYDEMEVERINAKLRHFRGIAANVMKEAMKVWQQIWEECSDPRTCDDILGGDDTQDGEIPLCGWPEFMEKLHLLGHYIDYTKRLCEGSIDKASTDEMEE